MSAQSSGSQIWVWGPATDDKDVAFQHPSDVPIDDEALSRARFVDQLRGPRLARISQATFLEWKGNNALIAENGVTREVPKPMIMNWYEGLLLLEELEGAQAQGSATCKAAWCDDELKGVLERERAKFRNGLSGALYTERRLLTTAATGMRFIDSDDKEWNYRRDNLRAADDKMSLAEAEEGSGFFKLRDILGYLPPWEAFCHDKCGFYQDFYQVRWDTPFSEVDYARVENGCTNAVGATWEPDECIPAHLDFMRLAAKRAWIKRQREKEQRATDERARKLAGKKGGAEPEPSVAAVKRPSPEVVRAAEPVKRARKRRDGMPLERDLFHSALGHDFAPGEIESFGGIRSGWPKHPQDYPKGYGVANPPGFCWEGCDCMDDQRPQRSSETHKAWLEDPVRSAAANSAIEALSAQTRFVRRRGQVSKMCFFETPQTVLANGVHARAALDLAAIIERAVMTVLRAMPLQSLGPLEPAVCIPASAMLFEDLDYEPLSFDGALPGGGELPPWLGLDADNGRLSVEEPPALAQPLQLRVAFSHSEGRVGAAPCGIVPERPAAPTPWMEATPPLAQCFGDPTLCQLERGTREGLLQHFMEIYDFGRHSAREVPLGAWLDIASRLLRMLRSTAVANVALAAVHRVPPQRPAPRTP